MGRPRLGPNKRTAQINIRVTEAVARRLDALRAHPLVRKAPGKPETRAGVAAMCAEDGLEFFEQQIAEARP